MQVVAGGCPPLKGRECVGIHRRETASQGGSRRITPVLVKDGCFCFLSLRRCEREKGNDAMALRARRERHRHGRSKQKIFIPALRLRGRKRKMKKNVDEYPVVRCWIAEELTFPPKTTCVKWSSIPRNDGNYNYGYFMIASSIRSVPKSIRFIGNFAEYTPVDDGGNIEEASDGVIWKCFEEKIVKDYLRDIE